MSQNIFIALEKAIAEFRDTPVLEEIRLNTEDLEELKRLCSTPNDPFSESRKDFYGVRVLPNWAMPRSFAGLKYKTGIKLVDLRTGEVVFDVSP